MHQFKQQIYHLKQKSKMKNTLKPLMMAAFFVGLGSTAIAQQAATAPASATVLSDLTITLDGFQNEIDFGNLSATTPGAVVLDANGAENANTGTATNVARFDLAGAEQEVTVSYDPTVTLAEEGGATMEMTPEVVGAASEGGQTAAAAVPSESTIVPVDGVYYLWVGGTIPALAGQTVGTYEGTFNIEVEYN